MEVSDAKQLRALERENRRLKEMFALTRVLKFSHLIAAKLCPRSSFIKASLATLLALKVGSNWCIFII